MKVEQISIFIENQKGRLADVTRALGEAGVNIRGLVSGGHFGLWHSAPDCR